MKNTTAIILWGGLLLSTSLLSPQPLLARACQGDEATVEAYEKSLMDLVGKVQKESLKEFQRDYHEQTCLTTLTLCYTAASDAMNCLEKAEKNPTVTKDQINAEEARQAAYVKLRKKTESERKALKAAKGSKDAKALIGKFH